MPENSLTINEKGHLAIGGFDTLDLVNKYKTPLYVMDEELIRDNIRLFKKSINKHYGGNGLVCFAGKAFLCKAMCRLIKEENAGLDVASAGELHTAVSADFPVENICFHGSAKTEEELIYAVEAGVGRIAVDNINELEALSRIASEQNKRVNVCLRIKPGVDAHTHEFVKTGHIDSKFGFALETGEAFDAVKKALSSDGINLTGLHCHIGSQIFDMEPFEFAASVMLGLIAKIKNELDFEISELNLGGGFGIKYTDDDNPTPYINYMEKVSAAVKESCLKLNIKLPFIIIEPGRSVVGPAGITLYTVKSVKNIPGIRKFVSVDGGLTDNPRYSLYGAKYEIMAAEKASEPKTETVTLAGKCCENDYLGENMPLQKVEAGDIVAVLSTGAYNYSMSSNYNRFPKPPVVFVSNGESRLAVKRETLDDIIRNDL